jgi:TIR domain
VIDAFSGSGVTAFLSSDRQSLPAGRKWLDVVKANLERSEAAIAVLSPEALKRPWPNIELGAAWIREIAVISFCHSGIRASDLPRPFGDFHGVNIDNEDPGRDLFGGVADALKLHHPNNLDFPRFKREVATAARGIYTRPPNPLHSRTLTFPKRRCASSSTSLRD